MALSDGSAPGVNGWLLQHIILPGADANLIKDRNFVQHITFSFLSYIS